MADIGTIIKSAGVHLGDAAEQTFGAAIEEFGRGTIEPVLRDLVGIKEEVEVINRNDGTWHSSDYAHSLANTNYRPKLKFLFKVEFLFKPDVIATYPDLQNNKFTFLIKTVDRPKVDFDYEDVNMYNFRTKVLKQIKHRELTMTFSDDVGNQVHDFFRTMMMIYSPITRRSINSSFNIADQAALYNSGHGMVFTDEPGVNNDFAIRGAIGTDIGNAIETIKLTQMFVQPMPGANGIDAAAKEVAFFFINPRIVSFDLDDVNHEVSEANLYTMQFDYDFMVMSALRELQADPPEKRLPNLPGAPGEPLPTGRSLNQEKPEGFGTMDVFGKILSTAGGRVARKITNETIGRKIRQIPGIGGYASYALGGMVDSVVKSSVLGVTGRASTLITDTVPSLSTKVTEIVNDVSTVGSDVANIIRGNGG